MSDGGCLCEALRYACRGAPAAAGYCHCRLCRRSAGAPVLAWASFSVDAFRYTQGVPGVFKSSAQGRREFCRDCGSQLLFRDTADGRFVDVNIATLDDPEALRPQYHIWTESRLSWFDVADRLPRHRQDGPPAA